jgi:hypothetical protein
MAMSIQGKLAVAEVNVYGKPMTNCGSDHAGGCTYVAEDAGAHQVCVTSLPHGFSSDTGQGPWSDAYQGQPWCICIWAYSNYILQKKDLKLKCESIPSKVLEEQYSLDKFKECGSMSSTEGCGSEDIRRSIESLCQQCDQETKDQDSKTALKGKCDAILASAPAVPLSRLYNEDTSDAKGVFSNESKHGFFQFGALGVFAVAMAGALLAFVGTIATRRISARFLQTTEGQPSGEDLLTDCVE